MQWLKQMFGWHGSSGTSEFPIQLTDELVQLVMMREAENYEIWNLPRLTEEIKSLKTRIQQLEQR